MFFNIGGGELLVIAMVALIAVGPEQLPSVIRKVGRGMAQVRSMTAGLRDEFMSGIDEVTDAVDPAKWTGSGSPDDPVVPRGYAERQDEATAPSIGSESGNGSGDDVVVNKIAQSNARSSAAPRASSSKKETTADTAVSDDTDAAAGGPMPTADRGDRSQPPGQVDGDGADDDAEDRG